MGHAPDLECDAWFPELEVLISKRDLEGAFKRIWMALLGVHLYAADIPAKQLLEAVVVECAKDVVAREKIAEVLGGEFDEGKVRACVQTITNILLVLEFGWTGSPGNFQEFARGSRRLPRAGRQRIPDGTARIISL